MGGGNPVEEDIHKSLHFLEYDTIQSYSER